MPSTGNSTGVSQKRSGRNSPAALIGASDFFELAVAVAITLFGANSPVVLVTTVGVLTEVPVMLLLVKFVNKTRHWFPQPDTDNK